MPSLIREASAALYTLVQSIINNSCLISFAAHLIFHYAPCQILHPIVRFPKLGTWGKSAFWYCAPSTLSTIPCPLPSPLFNAPCRLTSLDSLCCSTFLRCWYLLLLRVRMRLMRSGNRSCCNFREIVIGQGFLTRQDYTLWCPEVAVSLLRCGLSDPLLLRLTGSLIEGVSVDVLVASGGGAGSAGGIYSLVVTPTYYYVLATCNGL